ncbi:hypothetical protein NEOC95_000167 [Neochlamydia sp. AcF95]|nr:hypothetical protein [Neochlamydia sp. AcF95]
MLLISASTFLNNFFQSTSLANRPAPDFLLHLQKFFKK